MPVKPCGRQPRRYAIEICQLNKMEIEYNISRSHEIKSKVSVNARRSMCSKTSIASTSGNWLGLRKQGRKKWRKWVLSPYFRDRIRSREE